MPIAFSGALPPSSYTNGEDHVPFFTTHTHPQAFQLGKGSTPGLCKVNLPGDQMGKPGVASCQDSTPQHTSINEFIPLEKTPMKTSKHLCIRHNN